MMWNNGCLLGNWGAYGAWGWVGMILNLVFWVALIAGLIYLVVWMVRRAGASFPAPMVSSGQAPAGAMPAADIVKMRYARGEITRDEYLKLIEDLR